MRDVPRILPVLLLLAGFLPGGVDAQSREAEVRTYLQGVGCFFRMPPGEVQVLSQGRVSEEEIPVILFLASRAGVSGEVLVALRRTGASWMELARRYGMDAAVLHFPLGGASPGAALARAYDAYGAVAPREWGKVTLTDQEVVGLVNLRFLTEHNRIPPSQVLQARERAGDWVGAFIALGGRTC